MSNFPNYLTLIRNSPLIFEDFCKKKIAKNISRFSTRISKVAKCAAFQLWTHTYFSKNCWDLRLFPPIFWILLSLALKVTSIGNISKENKLTHFSFLALTVFDMSAWKYTINFEAKSQYFFSKFSHVFNLFFKFLKLELMKKFKEIEKCFLKFFCLFFQN